MNAPDPRTAHSPESALLEARAVEKVFPGVRALDGVDFTLRRSEIHALLGENGAGKSTLIKVLTGVYRRSGGTILLDGQPINPASTGEAQQLGISTVYQEVNLIPGLSVAENLFLGRQPRKWGGLIDWRSMRRRAQEAMARLNLNIDVTRPLDSQPIAIQQMVAIARAVDVSAKVLILDEPTSSLDRDEVARLFDVMRRLKAQGMGIVFVTHFLDQVYAVSDRITVLRNGKLVGAYDAAALPRLDLISKMIGRDAREVEAHHTADEAKAVEGKPPFLSAKKLGKRGSIEPFDLDLRPGEVVGLAGLLGSGRTETARLLFGIDRPDSGELTIDGVATTLRTPRQAVDRKLAFCPEDRKAAAIIPDLSIRENIVLALQARRGWLRRLSRRRQDEIADKYIKALRIATPDAEKPIKLLSGGNQQKAILARWLLTEPRLLILDEPTRGIDVGAKFEIAKLIDSLCAEGMSLLFISSELEEVVRSCRRVIVLRDRHQVGELTGERISEQNIMSTIAAG
jgi:simple sugar transport system ATP-binding protein